MLSRRHFIKLGAAATAAAGLSLTQAGRLIAKVSPDLRWAFLLDTTRCVGCGLCVRACKLENELPYDANVSRTWVERYIVKRDGTVLADSPLAARDGFTENVVRTDPKRPEGIVVPESEIEKTFFVPKLCNMCDKPPCVQVCPVGATYQTGEGIVSIDRKWCIGCGYCIMACPYGVRFFHPVHRVTEKCNWCDHRLAKGMKPACVDACPFQARLIGNYRDPDDPVTKVILTQRVDVLKDEYGTNPMAFYLGHDQHIR